MSGPIVGMYPSAIFLEAVVFKLSTMPPVARTVLKLVEERASVSSAVGLPPSVMACVETLKFADAMNCAWARPHGDRAPQSAAAADRSLRIGTIMQRVLLRVRS
jgi:hypothetical protein